MSLESLSLDMKPLFRFCKWLWAWAWDFDLVSHGMMMLPVCLFTCLSVLPSVMLLLLQLLLWLLLVFT